MDIVNEGRNLIVFSPQPRIIAPFSIILLTISSLSFAVGRSNAHSNPIPRAFEAGEEFAKPWENAATVAAGLRVPGAIGDFLILRAVRESSGTAIAVSDEALILAQSRMASREGVFACPEGGATLAALEKLLANGWIGKEEKVVLFNTGTGLKYPEAT